MAEYKITLTEDADTRAKAAIGTDDVQAWLVHKLTKKVASFEANVAEQAEIAKFEDPTSNSAAVARKKAWQDTFVSSEKEVSIK